MLRSRTRRTLALAGWGLFIAVLVVLSRDPGLVQRARHATRDRTATEQDCALAATGSCTARFADGLQVTLTASPVGLTPGTPASWTVHAEGEGITVDGLELTGVTMPMGVTTLPMHPTATGGWQAEGALPVCVASRMLWRADVLLSSGGGQGAGGQGAGGQGAGGQGAGGQGAGGQGAGGQGAGAKRARKRIAGFQFWTGEGPQLQASPGRGAAAPDAPQPTHSDFSVETAQGPLALSDLRGKVVILYFGYTACPDVCPTTLATLAAAVALLPPDQQARVTALMVSLDPARDGVDRLQTYASHFHPSFLAGTTTDPQLDAITADWGVAWRVTPLGDSALSYAVDHATFSTLVDPQGNVVSTIDHGTPPDEIARRIAAALSLATSPG